MMGARLQATEIVSVKSFFFFFFFLECIEVSTLFPEDLFLMLLRLI